uniref:GL n=1 Tax=Parastrongyloides trichosuri TaxID=131310 RepID=A0A0N4ZVD9_PARTI
MKNVSLCLILLSSVSGDLLFYDTECPGKISKLEKSFYTGFNLSTMFSNFQTTNGDYELVSITYNLSRKNEIIRIDGAARFPRDQVWTKKYIPIKSWPVYLHPNCFKFYNNTNDCLPRMDAIIIYPINDKDVIEPFKFLNFQFNQIFPCNLENNLSLYRADLITLINNTAVFVPRTEPLIRIKNFSFEEFALDNLYKYDEFLEQYQRILKNMEKLEQFSINADVNYIYDFDEPLGPFKKIHDIVYDNGNIREV